MRFISEIQSFSDIITNSSSEVFLMRENDAEYYNSLSADGCISIERINEEWLSQNLRYNWELIFEYLNFDKKLVSEYKQWCKHSYSGYWDYPDEGILDLFMEEHKEEFGTLVGLYIVDIEDHFEDACDVLDNARGDALASENRH